ncbi:hypothetical protein N5D48_02525 [Pseudomonas sp. GD03858]|uniref:hypothetical protein n=1 Tax=unclassified Pseudomonas TaxID=196821 RepID=UPI00244688D3|nr:MULTISPECIES: hypothetical protein [unclassified Pseudomonas]MDH0645591.1 hypothetical protein [Pseudomonas sp. GD03867]MDH0661271.1 hypothetical protein [Pseudomonas sp. GD03858]
MPAGLQVLNDKALIQIDGTFQNLCLVAKGTISTTTGNQSPYPWARFARIDYPVAARQPIIAFNTQGWACYLVDDTGFKVFGMPASGSGSAPLVVEYFIFDLPQYAQALGNVGLQVWSEQGLEVFHSKNRYMRVVGSYSVDIAYDTTHTGTAPPGIKLAVAPGVQSVGYLSERIGTNTQMGLAVRMWHGQCQTPAAGGSYLISNKLITVFAGPGLASNQGAVGAYNNGLVVDVTGY